VNSKDIVDALRKGAGPQAPINASSPSEAIVRAAQQIQPYMQSTDKMMEGMGGGSMALSFGGREALQNLIAAGLRNPEAMKKFDLAEKYMASGKTPSAEMMDDFWKRHEIDLGAADAKPRVLINPHLTDFDPITGSLSNPEFEAAFPGALSKLETSTTSPYNGHFSGGSDLLGIKPELAVNTSGKTREEISSVAEHELSHYAQHLSGHARGGSPSEWQIGKAEDLIDEAGEKAKELSRNFVGDNLPPGYLQSETDYIVKALWHRQGNVLTQFANGKTKLLENELVDALEDLGYKDAKSRAMEIRDTLAAAAQNNPFYQKAAEKIRNWRINKKTYETRTFQNYLDFAGENEARLSQVLRMLPKESLKTVRPSKVFDKGGIYRGADGLEITFTPRDEQFIKNPSDIIASNEAAEARILKNQRNITSNDLAKALRKPP
jgi:hypothetical protein